jgi:flagellar basal-body rod modification protein FlgD
MSVSAVNSSTSTPAAATTTAAAPQTVSLTEFMQLLSSEMSNQDPLQPMDPTQTMSQLAQFTTLQQMSQLSQTQGLAAANSLLGLQVSVPTGSGSNASTATGKVTGIDTSGVAAGSVPQVIVTNASGVAQEYPLTSLSQVAPVPVAPAATPGSGPTSSGSSSTPGN